ncbi:unnamed protein product [Mytilus edulis]|uniref:Uncharacterized protein n=1 Tax=Mytilus edulis TaxID=6550 RepID=A0A8S3PLM8_MYTED|nr:unnamed protein product [Mytilus edulis]
MLILLTLLQIVSSNVAYNFTCPSSAHWKIRAKSLCEPPRNYTCLFDVTYRVNVYRERCSRPRILAEGYKYVFQPNLNRATCSATRYQPFIFDTNGYSDCTYQKSLCNSLGQETYEIGNTSVDRLCTYIKCYDDVNLTRSPYLGDMFNNSRTIKIIEFDNFKYNLNYPTIPEPSSQWEILPDEDHREITDDIKRIVFDTNDVLNKLGEDILNTSYETFKVKVEGIVARFDSYLVQESCTQCYEKVISLDTQLEICITELKNCRK